MMTLTFIKENLWYIMLETGGIWNFANCKFYSVAKLQFLHTF